jgi:hypothetical protein
LKPRTTLSPFSSCCSAGQGQVGQERREGFGLAVDQVQFAAGACPDRGTPSAAGRPRPKRCWRSSSPAGRDRAQGRVGAPPGPAVELQRDGGLEAKRPHTPSWKRSMRLPPKREWSHKHRGPTPFYFRNSLQTAIRTKLQPLRLQPSRQ